MAEAKKEYLYPTREGPTGNDALKERAREIGAKIKFDREVGAYELVTDGLQKKEVTGLKSQLGEFVGKEAKGRWQADREAGLSAKEALRAAAKSREGTTQEPKPEKAVTTREEGILVYPAISQKAEFRKLVVDTQSESRFQKARGEEISHYVVRTATPEAFASYMGDEAKARYQREYAESLANGGKDKGENVNTPVERARDAARARGSAAFMAQYKDRGFRLGDASTDKGNHERQLNEMRAATSSQLLTVVKKSRELLNPLREKEVQMRADASGLSVDQVKAMSFADQKKILGGDGKPVGLVGEEFKLNVQLSRGIAAIEAEIKGRRGVGQEKAERSQERGQTQDQGQDRSVGTEKPKGKAVTEEQSADNDFATLSAGYARSRGARGR